MFKSPRAQWESILTKPLKKQSKFLNKVCKVNKNDALMIRGSFFDNLSFDLVRQVFDLVNDVVDVGDMDAGFRELIFDRLLWVSEIAHLYPKDPDAKTNIIFGEDYHTYSACYYDLELVADFIDSNEDIQSVCDLGSGSGRALLYLALEARRKINFLGLELIGERVEFTNSIAQHFELENLKFKTSNFLETPEDFYGYDAYYLFDPVGTDDVPTLISYFDKMIKDGNSFYILFVSGWDDLMMNALGNIEHLELIESFDSSKQDDRYVRFYKVK